MKPPDQRLFEEDIESADYRIGALKEKWGLQDSSTAWPNVVFWLAAAKREGAGDRYFIRLDFTGYRSDPPTGMFWNPTTNALVLNAERPRGRPNSRFAKVFRNDNWNNGTAFYHPYDRIAKKGHPQWVNEQPQLIWTGSHTIVDYLEEFYSLLQSSDYLGI